jgi:TolB-like protein
VSRDASTDYLSDGITESLIGSLAHVQEFGRAMVDQRPSEVYPRSSAAARRAMELDPSLALAHAVLGDKSDGVRLGLCRRRG